MTLPSESLAVAVILAALFASFLVTIHLAKEPLCKFFPAAIRARGLGRHRLTRRAIPGLLVLGTAASGLWGWQALVDRLVNANSFHVVLGYPADLAGMIGWSMVAAGASAGLCLHFGLVNRGGARTVWLLAGLVCAGLNATAQGYVAFERARILNALPAPDEDAPVSTGGLQIAGKIVDTPAAETTPVPPATAEGAAPLALGAIPFGLAIVGALSMGLGVHCLLTALDLGVRPEGADADAPGITPGTMDPSAEAAVALIQALAAVGAAVYRVLKLPFVPFLLAGSLGDGMVRATRTVVRGFFPTSAEQEVVVVEKARLELLGIVRDHFKNALAAQAAYAKQRAQALLDSEKTLALKAVESIGHMLAEVVGKARDQVSQDDGEQFLASVSIVGRTLPIFAGASQEAMSNVTGPLMDEVSRGLVRRVDAALDVDERSALRRRDRRRVKVLRARRDAAHLAMQGNGALVLQEEEGVPEARE